MADAVEGSERPLTPEARLDRGRRSKRSQDHGRALLAYYRAIIEAQRAGRWLDAGTTAPELLGRVTYAMRYVKAGRRRAFDAALAPCTTATAARRSRASTPASRSRSASAAPSSRTRGRSRRCSISRACPPRRGIRARLSLVRGARARDGGDPRGAARGDAAHGTQRARVLQRRSRAARARRRLPARRPGTGSTSGATASAATRTMRSARARRRRSRRCRSCASAATPRR